MRDRLCILLTYNVDYTFKDLFEEFGFYVLWSECIDELEELVTHNHVDLAIEWQHGERDFPVRDLLMRTQKDVPALLPLNWNGKAPHDYSELGYRHTLVVPFNLSELLAKFFDVLPGKKES